MFHRKMYNNRINVTWSERKPAVGVWSLGSDSGISPSGSFEWSPGQPTHKPLPFITTGATAVTKPPALQYKSHKFYINKTQFVQLKTHD